jgi:hypothetical protein
LAQCAGVGCGLVRGVAGEERARKVFSLKGLPGDRETSRLGSRDPVDGGTRCEPHGVEKSKTKSWMIEPVHGGGRVKGFGGRPGRARGVRWFAHKTIGGRFLGLGLKTKSEDPTRRRWDPGVSGSSEAEDTRRDRMACVGRTRGAAKVWPFDGKAHKHYIIAPAWVVSPIVELGVVESFPTPAGPDIQAMSVCG